MGQNAWHGLGEGLCFIGVSWFEGSGVVVVVVVMVLATEVN